MRLVDHRWPWIAACWLVFLAVVSAFHFWLRGINVDFLAGFGTGASLAAIIIFTAIGWRRGEMRR